MKYKPLLLLCACWHSQIYAADPITLTVRCPEAQELLSSVNLVTHLFTYSATVPIQLSSINNQLHFSGESSSKQVQNFYGATWTDRTFLCLYDYQIDPIIIYETQLYRYVDQCYFSHPSDSPRDECISMSTTVCQLTCQTSSTAVLLPA